MNKDEKLKYYIWGTSEALGVEPEDIDELQAEEQMNWCEENL